MSKLVKRQQQMPSLITATPTDGIEMGVLANGTGYLTGRGLANLCGVMPSVVNEWANEFDPNSRKPRDLAIMRALEAQGYSGELYYKTKTSAGEVNAYPDTVCMAVIEYYAFEAGSKNGKALRAYRTIARGGLRAFIYARLNYDPQKLLSDSFKSYHDRLVLNIVPRGRFSVFTETPHLVLASIRAGLVIGSHTVPDISVGQHWAKYWADNDLEARFGPREKHPHIFPADYKQSQVVPEAATYPVAALGVFRQWLDEEYLPSHYPGYLDKKIREGCLPEDGARKLLSQVAPRKTLPRTRPGQTTKKVS